MYVPRDSSFPKDSKGPMMLGFEITAIVISTLIISARIFIRARVTKALGLDDYIAMVAWIFMVAMTGVDIVTLQYGGGTSMDQLTFHQLIKFFSLLPVSLLLYFWTISLVRLSILAFLPRLNQERWYLGCIWGLALVIVVNTLVPFFHILTQCTPIIDLFHADNIARRCRSSDQEEPIMYAHSAIGVFIDICLFGLPILVIRKNMIFSQKIIQVILVFGVGLLVIVTGIIRLVIFITTDFNVNPTYKTVYLGPWTLFELHVGFWCGCFPALQPLVRAIASKFNLHSARGGKKMSTNADTFPTLSDGNPPHSDEYTDQSSSSQKTVPGASGAISDQERNISPGRPMTAIVELDRLQVTGPGRDLMRSSFENGKASYKTPWNAV